MIGAAPEAGQDDPAGAPGCGQLPGADLAASPNPLCGGWTPWDFQEGAAPRPRAPRGTLKEGCAMSLDEATDLIRHTLLVALIVSAPMLVIGLAVGIVVSLLQAVTQIQEQTLSFVPKIVAMVAAAIILMPWMGQRLLEYSAAMFSGGPLP